MLPASNSESREWPKPRLPQGAGCTVTVYTTFGKPVHVIGKVVMRMNAWKAYLTTPI